MKKEDIFTEDLNDPFYSKENQKFLMESLKEFEEGKGIVFNDVDEIPNTINLDERLKKSLEQAKKGDFIVLTQEELLEYAR
ncbi:MAG: hypothetical protein LBM93_03510 [Oscillospiraceae bacterium]|nr:hypothetical protein [Oscillospiraceae bacterium]